MSEMVIDAILYGSEITETEKSILIEVLKEGGKHGG